MERNRKLPESFALTGATPSILCSTYLGSPVFVKVIYACDATSVAVGVVHVAHVPRPVSRVTRHHRLEKTQMKSTVSKSRSSNKKKKTKRKRSTETKVFPPPRTLNTSLIYALRFNPAGQKCAPIYEPMAFPKTFTLSSRSGRNDRRARVIL